MAAGGNQLNAVLVFGGDAKGAVNAINTLNGKLTDLTNRIGKASKASSSTTGIMAGSKGFAGLTSVMTSALATLQRFIDGFRLVTQGLMSAGRALTFFISLPLAMFLKQGLQAAVDFEDQMVRVAKVTDLPRTGLNSLEELTLGLREIARTSPTTHKQLGMMAEQAGQLGIQSADGIKTFVGWMNILATSTNIAADDVVKTMGKISVAFGWNVDESADNIIRLANVMNMLENRTAATAGEIADALFRFAPVANQLNIAAEDAAALAAALISVGVSAESTGTRLGTMYIKLTQNTEEFANLAKNSEKYAEAADVVKAIDEDAVQVLSDLISMMQNTDSRAEKLAAAFDLVGLRGGRALGALAAGNTNLSDAMRVARIEWMEATSLVKEYNRQLESTKSHLDILKNNVTDVGIELGNTLLPAINDFVELLIPAIRRLIQFISVLNATNPGFIMLAAGITIAVVAIGPLLFLFSQLLFGISMVFLGFMKFVTVLWAATQAIGTVLVGIASLNVWILAFVGALIGLGSLVLRVLQNMGYDISGWFKNLAAKAAIWGENLSANIANGLLSGAVKFITKALVAIANLIASFLESHSPPDVGPLSHIDRWGEALIDTYLKSMTSADFSVLSKIGNTIGKIFSTFAAVGIIGEKNQFKLLLKARQDLAKLLSIWNTTGEISEKVLNDVVKNLRSAKDEVKELIKLELTMLGIEKELNELARRRTETQEAYAADIDEIAASGKSAEERVDLIRNAMRARNDELKAINKQETELEKQKTIAEEQLEAQRAMIEAMQQQDDIQAKLIDTLDDLAGALSGLGGGLELGEITAGGMPDPEDIFGELKAPVIELEIRIKSKEGLWDSFLAGLRGETTESLVTDKMLMDVPLSQRREQRALDMGVQPKDIDLFYQMNEVGLKINETYKNITNTIEGLKTSISNVFGGGIEVPEGALEAWDKVVNTFKAVGLVLTLIFGPALEGLKIIWEGFKKAVAPSFERLAESWENLKSKFKGSSAMRKLGAFFLMLGVIVGWLANIIVGIIGVISFFFSLFVDAFINAIATIMDYLAILLDDNLSFGEKLKAIWQLFLKHLVIWLSSFRDNAIAYFTAFWDYLKETAPKIFTMVAAYFTVGLQNLLTKINEWKTNAANKWEEWKEEIKAKTVAFFAGLLENFATGLLSLAVKIGVWVLSRIEQFRAFWENVKTVFSEKLEEIHTTVDTIIEAIKTTIGNWAEGVRTAFSNWVGGWLTSIEEAINNGIDSVTGAFESLASGAIDALQPLLSIINKIIDFVKNPPKISGIKLPSMNFSEYWQPGTTQKIGGGYSEFATGGIVTTRMKAIVGDVPEAIIPLTKLPSLMNRMVNYSGAGGGGGTNINLTFEIGSVDSKETADRLAEEVIRRLEDSINTGMTFGVGYR